MNKKSLIKSLACVLSAAFIVNVSQPVAASALTEVNYSNAAQKRSSKEVRIYSVKDLYKINSNLDGNYKLMRDLDFKGKELIPIGYDKEIGKVKGVFTGTFNGNNRKIKNFKITTGKAKNYNEINIGLFSKVHNAKIMNVKLKNVMINSENGSPSQTVGGAIGMATGNTTIYGVSVDGEIKGKGYLGGVIGYAGSVAPGKKVPVGYNYGTKIDSCAFSGRINTSEYYTYNSKQQEMYVGGVVGMANVDAPIDKSFFSGEITTEKPHKNIRMGIGGISGLNEEDMLQCAASGRISVKYGDNSTHAGFLTGLNKGGKVWKGSASGEIKGSGRLAGFVAFNTGVIDRGASNVRVISNDNGSSRISASFVNSNYGTIKDSRAANKIAGDGRLSAFVGYNKKNVVDCTTRAYVDAENEGSGFVLDNLGIIKRSSSKGSVKSSGTAAGFVSNNNDGIIDQTFHNGEVKGENKVSGFVITNTKSSGANSEKGKITNSYSICDVTGEKGVAGFIFENQSGLVENSYYVGVVMGTSEVGAFGYDISSSAAVNCYYNTSFNSDTKMKAAKGISLGSLTKEEVYKGFDFLRVWDLDENKNGSYPILRCFKYENDTDIISVSSNYKSSYITIKTAANAKVVIKIGSKTYKGTANGSGICKIKIGKQKYGRIYRVTVDGNRKGAKTFVYKIGKNISLKTPKVYKVTSKSSYVKGYANKDVKVYIKIGSKIYRTKTNSKGYFSKKIKAQKKGKKIYVYTRDAYGKRSKTNTIKVK